MRLARSVFLSASLFAVGCGSTSSGGTSSSSDAAGGATGAGQGGSSSEGPTGAGGMSAGPQGPGAGPGPGAGGATTGTGGSSSSTGGTSNGMGGSPFMTQSFTMQFGPITVPGKTERTQCVVKRLGNVGPVHIGNFHNVLGDASHHMIVYRVNDTVEQPTPFDCQPFTDTLDPAKGSTLMITQKKDEVLSLPDGVGYTLDDNQMIRLEMHYLNAPSDPVTLVSTTTMTTIADAAYKYEADFLFIGDPDISIDPHTKATLGPIFFKLPGEYADANFFAITGHEHHLGTNVTVDVAASKTDPGTPLYHIPGWLWSEPKTLFLNPTVQIPAGGGFNFTCDWNNTTDQTVTFGESAADREMCFFWAYYYPSHWAKVSFHTDKAPAGTLDLCCPGSALCSYIQQYLNK